MGPRTTRRGFLRTTAAAGSLAGLAPLLPVARAGAAAESRPNPKPVVSLADDLEPLVRHLEEIPRPRLVESVAARVRDGLTQEQLLAAVFLAGVRNIEPRPSVGFKFHAVLVARSIHLACQAIRQEDGWLPLFWAADYFKDCQEQDERERGWTMGPADEAALPAPAAARSLFVDALDHWDEAKTDAAVTRLARAPAPADIWELLFRYGARDFRSIGHKAIDVANTHRLLGVIGWRHAEPALRSLAYALLMHEDGNPAERDDAADRPGRDNQELGRKFPANWQHGEVSPEAARELLVTIRTGSAADASDQVAKLLARGVAPVSLWDGLLLAAVELLVRQPGIVSLHAVTTTNALHYAFYAAQEDQTRRYVLLQNAAFLPMFQEAMRGRGSVSDFAVDRLEPLKTEKPSAAVEEIFQDVGRNPLAAARKTCGYVESGGSLEPWAQRALDLIVAKGSDAHDYKFGCAVLEDLSAVSPAWRSRFLGASVFHLPGATEGDNSLIARVRAALAR